jgi:soluble lytic murein transglycosylase
MAFCAVLLLTALLGARLAGCADDDAEVARFEAILARSQDPEARKSEELADSLRRFIRQARDEDLRLRAAYIFGSVLRDALRWDDAARAFEQCDTPEFPLRDFARYYRAQAAVRLERFGEAETLYASLLGDFPDFPLRSRAQLALGEVLQASGQLERALAVFRGLAEDQELGREARYRAAAAQAALGDSVSALDALQAVIEERPGDALSARALDLLRDVTSRRPSRTFSRRQQFVHAQVLHANGRRREARGIWERVAAGSRDELAAKALYEVGLSHMREREYDEAVAVFRQILRSGHVSHRPLAQFQRILATRRAGKRTAALRLFRDYLAAYPSSPVLDEVLMEYAWTYRDGDDHAAALPIYGQLLTRFPSSRHAEAAAWFVAWCRIRLGQYAQAVQALDVLLRDFPEGELAGRAHFWQGKGRERLGEWESAAESYRRVIASNTPYYTGRAYDRLAALAAEGRVPDRFVRETQRQVAKMRVPLESLAEMPFPRVRLLRAVRDYDGLSAEANAIMRRDPASRPLLYYHLMLAYQEAGQPYQAYAFADRFANQPEVRGVGKAPPPEIGRMLYPYPYAEIVERAGIEFGLDPYFIAAMVREESRFNARAVSPSGARGLAQIMPETGAQIARRLGIEPFNASMLFDPEVSIRLGSSYMRTLLDRFGGDLYLVSGAYNGGPGRLSRWMEQYQIADRDEFVEHIPIDETRNHIKKVMHAYGVYRDLYGPPEAAAGAGVGAGEG